MTTTRTRRCVEAAKFSSWTTTTLLASFLFLLLQCSPCSARFFHRPSKVSPWGMTLAPPPQKNIHRHPRRHDDVSCHLLTRRGGASKSVGQVQESAETSVANDEDDDDDDEERYSRQVYTLGKRAHGLIRSSTVYLDGPATSGLLYEVVKNLALSGIRRLVLVVEQSEDDEDDGGTEMHYHDSTMDDLGGAYLRAARAELEDVDSSPEDVLMEYIKRLNPSVHVSCIERSALACLSSNNDEEDGDTSRRVLVSIDRPYDTQVSLNDVSRQNDDTNNNMAFVALETAGVFGRIFCDFGPTFDIYDADGETPLVTPLHRLEIIDDTTAMIHCMDDEKHDVSKGDQIRFLFRNGGLWEESTCSVQEVQTPFRFVVRFDAITEQPFDLKDVVDKLNNHAAAFSRVKIPQQVSFIKLSEAMTRLQEEDESIASSLFTACDLDKSSDVVRRDTSLACFQALSNFVQEHQRLAMPRDAKTFLTMVEDFLDTHKGNDAPLSKKKKEARLHHVTNFVNSCAAKFSPFQAVLGAVGAQEILKAATGLYYPVHQFLLYDCDEVLATKQGERDAQEEDEQNTGGHDAGLRHILGHSTVTKLQEKKIFVVGAGAIGCELLKDLAAMGIATRKKGKIVLTDMDTIEKSNLSRQLLFRDSDLGKFKSAAAQDATRRFQPKTRLEAHSSKVGGSEHTPFDDKFWAKKVDIVLSALDNVDARIYMDGRCVANQKALVDAGTMGPKGNVQVVVPYQSESYASSVDPPEQGIPLCTLKNFPYAIAHTIQWGRDLFDGMFRLRPSQANDFLDVLEENYSISDMAEKLIRDRGEESATKAAEELAEDLSVTLPDKTSVDIRGEALAWAVRLARKLYVEAVEELLKQHPLGSTDDDGELFWSGTRRPPQVLIYKAEPESDEQSRINENIIDFVTNAARLRFESFLHNERGLFDVEEVKAALIDDSCVTDSLQRKTGSDAPSHDQICELLEQTSSSSSRLNFAEFEKDNEANGHVAFVTAASNLRAISYGIPPVDAMETRRVAGNIIPAMITTTAFVSALSCIELVKLVQEAPLGIHRNAFINLALPFFAFTAPLPAETITGLQGKEYSLWDRLYINENQKTSEKGGLKLKSLLKRIQKLASDEPESVEVSSVALGPYLLYASFLNQDDKKMLKSSIWDIVTEAIASSDDDMGNDRGDEGEADFVVSFDDSIDLIVMVEDVETGEEVELPPVCIKRYKNEP